MHVSVFVFMAHCHPQRGPRREGSEVFKRHSGKDAESHYFRDTFLDFRLDQLSLSTFIVPFSTSWFFGQISVFFVTTFVM